MHRLMQSFNYISHLVLHGFDFSVLILTSEYSYSNMFSPAIFSHSFSMFGSLESIYHMLWKSQTRRMEIWSVSLMILSSFVCLWEMTFYLTCLHWKYLRLYASMIYILCCIVSSVLHFCPVDHNKFLSVSLVLFHGGATLFYL